MPREKTDPAVRFRRFFDVEEGDACWEWQGGKCNDGYGHFRVSALRQTKASIYAWELANGEEVREGYEIHHKCHNRGCVNPTHLLKVTKRQNLLNRGRWKCTKEFVDGVEVLSSGTAPLTVTLSSRHSWLIQREGQRREMDPEEFLARALDSYFIDKRKSCDL